MIIAYHGLGYVGLTGAVHFATSGNVAEVIGYDPDQDVVDAINAGKPKAGEFLHYLSSNEKHYRSTLWATTDFSDTLAAQCHIIAVPSEKNDRPYMEIVESVVKRLLDVAPDNTTIIVESTLTPGTIDRILTTHRTRIDDSTITLAVAPRRDWFADPAKNLTNLERIVGGVNEASTLKAVELLSKVTDPTKILATGYREAELVKATENALFHAPIMLLHELALRYPEANVAEVAKLASTHWRFASLGALYIGVGSGGRCVPLGPQYLAEGGTDYHMSLTMLGSAVSMERTITELATSAIVRHAAEFWVHEKPNKSVMRPAALLGVAYRPEFKDAGMSPGLRLAKRLGNSLPVSIHDPMWSEEELAGFGFPAISLNDAVRQDILILTTPHSLYIELPETMPFKGNQLIFDVHGTWADYKDVFQAQGSLYVQVGTPGWIPK